MISERLRKQFQFIVEVDKLKQVYRQTLLTDGSRNENDAEHSWHLALLAVLLAEYASDPGMDMARVLKMVIVHDLVEIDAGDTYCYDRAGNATKADRERRAADRIFGMLPNDQAADLRQVWEEFEARSTPEARFAAALDRVQPLLHNFCTQGRMWREHGVTAREVMDRNRHVADGAPVLWEYAESLIHEAVARKWLAP
jgi:putative hydrolases of HD superfamily